MADPNRSVGYETVMAVQQERIAALTQENVMLAAALREADTELAAKNTNGDASALVPAQREPDAEPGS